MFKTIAIVLALVLSLGLLAISPCFADDTGLSISKVDPYILNGGDAAYDDGESFWDQVGDIFSGKGNGYVGGKLINIPFFGPLTAEGWLDVLAGKIDDGVKRDVRGGFRAVADWQKIFK